MEITRKNKYKFKSLVSYWSITWVLAFATILFVLLAAIIQYFIFSNLTGQFRTIYEQEAQVRLVMQMQMHNSKVLRAMQLQDQILFQEITKQILAADDNYYMVFYYDKNKQLIYSQTKNYSDEKFTQIKNSLQLNEIPSTRNTTTQTFDHQTKNIDKTRFLDSLVVVELNSDYASSPGVTAGYMRIFSSQEKIDSKITQIKFVGIIFVILSMIISSIFFIFILYKTVMGPLKRATEFIEKSMEDFDVFPKLKTQTSNAKEVNELLSSLEKGIFENFIRNKQIYLLDQTKKTAEKSTDENFLETITSTWFKNKLVNVVQLSILQYNPSDKKYQIEKTYFEVNRRSSDTRVGEPTKNINRFTAPQVNPEFIQEYRQEVLHAFLQSSREIKWNNNVLNIKLSTDTSTNVVFVLKITPDTNSGIPLERFESIAHAWLTEVVYQYSQKKFRELSNSLEISREFNRTFTELDLPTLDNNPMQKLYASKIIQCDFINGDFVYTHLFTRKKCSLTILGDVSGHDIRSGLAATGLLAAIQERVNYVKDAEPEYILENIAACISRYLWRNYAGSISTGCTILYFNHSTGQGIFTCYGMPFPFVLSSRERKPMVIAPQYNHGLLGISELNDFSSTAFSILPGQLVFACTHGILSLENSKGKKFERAITHGCFQDISLKYFAQGAQILLDKYLTNAINHAEQRTIKDDISGFVLYSEKEN